MKRRVGRGGKRKGIEVDELSGGTRIGRRDAEVEKTTTAVALLYFLAAIIERGISKVEIKIKIAMPRLKR